MTRHANARAAAAAMSVLTVIGIASNQVARAETVFQVAALGGTAPAPFAPMPPDAAEVAVLGDVAVFNAAHESVGLEIWCTDGTARGTALLTDIRPGAESSDAKVLVRAGGYGFFIAQDGSHGYERCRTEGTSMGTRLVGDICPGACDGLPYLNLNIYDQRIMAAAGDTVVFAADDGVHGVELWRSDGLEAGTWLVADLRAGAEGSAPGALISVGESAYFGAGGDLDSGMWRTDGTGAGTAFVSHQGLFVAWTGTFSVLGSELYFISRTEAHGVELWASDGSPSGTRMVADLCPGECSGLWMENWLAPSLDVVDGRVFFTGYRPDTGVELWSSDGTATGTRLEKDCNPGQANGVSSVAVSGGRLFLIADDGRHGPELWAGGAGGSAPAMIADYYPGSTGAAGSRFVAAGGLLYFRSYGGLWRSDGTLRGTGLIFSDLANTAGYWSLMPLDDLAGRLFFVASTTDGRGPWISDGSPAGTVAVTVGSSPTWKQPGAYPRHLAPMAAGVAFIADHEQGSLWFSGYELGSATALSSGGLWSTPSLLSPLGQTLYFSLGEYGLWKTDLAVRSPERVYVGAQWGSGISAIRVIGERVFFADDLGQGRNLYVTDGTAAGTVLVRDLCPGGCNPDPGWLTPFGQRMAFTAIRFGAADGALWVTDGTAKGTVELAALGADFYTSSTDFGVVAGAQRFYATLTRSASGAELWRSDGTKAGTLLVKDICPGPCDGLTRPGAWWEPVHDRAVAAPGDRLYFLADDGEHGRELWVTDGTAETTRMVADLTAGSGGSTVTWLTAAKSGAFFVRDDGEHGRELWRTDGTAAGTELVEDVNPGVGSADPQGLVWADDVLLFAATDGLHGLEPWRQELVRSGRHVFFRAYGLATGFELWAIELDGNERVRRRVARK